MNGAKAGIGELNVQMPTRLTRVLVAACGNRVAGDDAFGPLVAERLSGRVTSALDIIDLGLRPIGLVDHLEGYLGLIIVDAVVGFVTESSSDLVDMDFAADGRPELRHDVALSSHGLSIEHELRLAETLGILPGRVHLIGVVASCVEVGLPPTQGVLRCIEPAVERVIDVAHDWLAVESSGGKAGR